MTNQTGGTQRTVTVPAGGTANALLAVGMPHVCQFPGAILFDTARSFVKPTTNNKNVLQDLLTHVQNPGRYNQLLIVGHTDSVGTPQSNRRLSERRAQSVTALLRGNVAEWETLFRAERWSTRELTHMVIETGEVDPNDSAAVSQAVDPYRRSAKGGGIARAGLFRRYFERLLGIGGTPSISFVSRTPPWLGCGEQHLLRGSRSSPSRNTSLPPIQGDFEPNRRVEFFFVQNVSTLNCSEYPKWTLACTLWSGVTVSIAEVKVIEKNQNVTIQITLAPTPLPKDTSITLELSTITGTGEAKFTSNNSSTLEITQSTKVTIRGITASSVIDNVCLSAKLAGQTQILAQECFTVVDLTGCNFFQPAVSDPDYTRYVQPATRGLVRPLINGRSSGGAGPDVDLTEPLREIELVVKSLGSGDFVYLAAWFFEPATSLTTGGYSGASDWGHLFARKAAEGVKIRIIINDFDPISGMDSWLQRDGLTPLNSIILALPAGVRNNYKYIVSMHPAHVGFFKSLLAGQGGRPINIASHHQKFMVVRRGEETFAFCGGLDIESRKTPNRWAYVQTVQGRTVAGLIGWHDIHTMLEGPITRDLEKEFVNRWNREKGASTRNPLTGWSGYETLSLPTLSATDNTAAKKRHRVQMIRTVSSDATFSPYTNNRDDIKKTYRRAIACARRFLYFENQYFRATELADWIIAQARAKPNLIVIMVVVGSAADDDGDNAITQHGNHLQFETFDRIVRGVASSRFRLYTMKNRAVHSKFLMVDDTWMTIGSANANVRSFELDSELNISVHDPLLVKDFRQRLWSHNLGVSKASVGAWSVSDFISQWDAVANSNVALNTGYPADWKRMAGEGVLPFDYTAARGQSHGSIPDALAQLDLAPEGKLFAGRIRRGFDTPQPA